MFSRFFIDRPIFAFVISILLVASGSRTPWVDLSRRSPYARLGAPHKGPTTHHEPGEQAVRSHPA
jgi:hypothetical protein